MGKYSFGKIIEIYTDIKKNTYFIGQNTDITLKENSECRYLKFCTENTKNLYIGNTRISLEKNSSLKSNFFISSYKNCKNQIYSYLGKSAKISIDSLILVEKNKKNQISTRIFHNKSGSISKQNHKIITKNFGKGYFSGLVKIYKNSNNSYAIVKNQNLLLEKFSKVSSHPNLEIYNKDVFCKHSATVFKVEKKIVFYLLTRGISKKKIRKLLILAFVKKIKRKIEIKEVKKIFSLQITEFLKEKK
nr:SufD family Fe-S cluster assembly protein [bacterium endosymbiont of Pedicinus badii]